jgi:hypothetical protein
VGLRIVGQAGGKLLHQLAMLQEAVHQEACYRRLHILCLPCIP